MEGCAEECRVSVSKGSEYKLRNGEVVFNLFVLWDNLKFFFSWKEYPCNIFKLADDKIAFSGTTDRKPKDAQGVTGYTQESLKLIIPNYLPCSSFVS